MLDRFMRHLRDVATAEERELQQPACELHAAVLELHPSVFGSMATDAAEVAAADDRLQLLIMCVPPPAATWRRAPRKASELGEWTSDECVALGKLAQLRSLETLEPPEDFCWRMMQICDDLRGQLSAFHLLQFRLGPALRQQLSMLSQVSEACDELVSAVSEPSGVLHQICGRALSLGNQINGRHRVYGNAAGFSLDGLVELSHYHTAQGGPRALEGVNLLHYLAAHLLVHLPSQREWPTQRMAFSANARSYMSRVKRDLSALLALDTHRFDLSDTKDRVSQLRAEMAQLAARMERLEDAAGVASDARRSTPAGSCQTPSVVVSARPLGAVAPLAEGNGGLDCEDEATMAPEGLPSSLEAVPLEAVPLEEVPLEAVPLEEVPEAEETEMPYLDYHASDSEADRTSQQAQMATFWASTFRVAMARAAYYARSSPPPVGGCPISDHLGDEAWSAARLVRGEAVLCQQLQRLEGGLQLVSDVFGTRFTSGREERVEALEHLSAIRRFIPQFEHALTTVQQMPSLLRLAALATDETPVRARFAVAGLHVAPPVQSGMRQKSMLRTVMSAWESSPKAVGLSDEAHE